jgi:hypothetical protein
MIIRFRPSLTAAFAFLVLMCGAPAAAQKTRPATPPGPRLEGPVADSVRGVLQAYVDAVSRQDGEAAARLVTRATRDHYARMRDMAVSAPEARVRAMPLMDRMYILMMRHLIPIDELRVLAGDAVFAYTITHGWLGSDAQTLPPGASEVYGEGDRAVLRMGPEDVQLMREDGAWRWDMMPLIQAASAEFAPEPGTGMTEDDLLMQVLEYSNGRRPSRDIWQPLP